MSWQVMADMENFYDDLMFNNLYGPSISRFFKSHFGRVFNIRPYCVTVASSAVGSSLQQPRGCLMVLIVAAVVFGDLQSRLISIGLQSLPARKRWSLCSQCPRADLNKKFLARPKTTAAWKLIPHRSKISKNWNPTHWDPLLSST